MKSFKTKLVGGPDHGKEVMVRFTAPTLLDPVSYQYGSLTATYKDPKTGKKSPAWRDIFNREYILVTFRKGRKTIREYHYNGER